MSEDSKAIEQSEERSGETEKNDAADQPVPQPGKIEEIATSQIELFNTYYDKGLDAAKSFFNCALVVGVIGIVILVGAMFFATDDWNASIIIATVVGTLSEFTAMVLLGLYARALRQLNHFHERLDLLQRYLLANSICELLDEKAREEVRSELVKTIACFS